MNSRDEDIRYALRRRARWRAFFKCNSMMQRINGNYEDQLLDHIEDLEKRYIREREKVLMFRSRVAKAKALLTETLIETDKME